jgi:hypothetical protein
MHRACDFTASLWFTIVEDSNAANPFTPRFT